MRRRTPERPAKRRHCAPLVCPSAPLLKQRHRISKGLNPTRSTTALPSTADGSPRTIREFPAELKIPCLSSLGDDDEDDDELAPEQAMRSADSRRRLSLFFEFGGSSGDVGDVGELDELLSPQKSQKRRADSTAAARSEATPRAAAAKDSTSFSPNDVTADLGGLRRLSPDTNPKCLFVPNLRSSA